MPLPGADGPRLSSVLHAVGDGNYLIAYDRALEALERDPDDALAHYLAALALARAGAGGRALRQLDVLGPSAEDPAQPELARDVSALRARIAKDAALRCLGPDRPALAAHAGKMYEATFARFGGAYPCINAATMTLLAGDEVRARNLARRALALVALTPHDSEGRYWDLVTAAEAHIILGDPATAGVTLGRAHVEPAADLGKRATTRRQLILVCRLRGVDTELLEALPVPEVVHYCGRRVATPTSAGFPPEDERALAEALSAHLDSRHIGLAYGSLAHGADILFAEAVLAHGAELHAVLPFPTEEFVAVSVAPAGTAWVQRFERCLRSATTVLVANDGEYLGDDALFDYCSRVAMGKALVRSAFLGASVHQVAVWDGEDGGDVGTAADMRTWGRTGHASSVVRCRRSGAGSRPPSCRGTPPRQLRAVLFADVKGFSSLRDSQIPDFFAVVVAALAKTLDRYGDAVLYRNGWGDAVYVVVRDVATAADCALAMQETIGRCDLVGAGLPPGLGLRIGAHVGPVFQLQDPVRCETTYTGLQVTRAARIEPRTPVGEVYVTDPFAALVALDPDGRFSCEYVGYVPMPKDYGRFPMYVLRRSADLGAGTRDILRSGGTT